MIKITSLLIAFALFISAPAFAEGKCCAVSGKGNSGEKNIERLKEKLSLSDAQAVQIKAILDSNKEKMMTLKKEKHDQVTAVLTPEQKEKHEAMTKEFKENCEEHKDH